MANASRLEEMHRGGHSAEDSQDCGTYWFILGWRAEGTYFRLRCHRGTAAFAVACPFSGIWVSGDFEIERSESAVWLGYAAGRAIPTLRILCWRVDRFFRDVLPPLSAPSQPCCTAPDLLTF